MKAYTRANFVKVFSPFAKEVTEGTGIFPSVLLTQAIIEAQGKANDGNWYVGLGLVARKANNLFGIKSFSRNEKRIQLPTPGDAQKKSFFVVYSTPYESIKGYVNFLKNNKRYSKAFEANTPEEQIKAIAKAGYSEKPIEYEKLLLSIEKRVRKVMELNSGNTNVQTVEQKPLQNTGNSLLPVLLAVLLGFVYYTLK